MTNNCKVVVSGKYPKGTKMVFSFILLGNSWLKRRICFKLDIFQIFTLIWISSLSFKAHNLFCWHHLLSLCDSYTADWSYHWLLFFICLDTKHWCIPSLAVGTSQISFVSFCGTWDAPHILFVLSLLLFFQWHPSPKELVWSEDILSIHQPGRLPVPMFSFSRSCTTSHEGPVLWGWPCALNSLAQDACKIWPKL